VRFAELFRNRAFLVLYGTEAQSIVGDQLARIALSFLVFERTGSVAETALTYAATFLPAIFGGTVLAGIGDRVPRRAVMVGCDLARGGLFAAMAIPQLPLPVVVGLLVVAVFLGPAFAAAEVSYLAAAVGPRLFHSATGLRMMTNQVGQVFGFAVGGVLVAALSPRGALLVDATTYLLSALLIGGLLKRRSAPASDEAIPPAAGVEPEVYAGPWRDRLVRALIALSALAGFFVVPEGLAVPFAHHIAATTVQTGFLLASMPLGGAVGAYVLIRTLRASQRTPTAAAAAICCGLPLLATAWNPSWPVVWVCWFASGVLAAYQVEAVTAIVQAVPDIARSRVVGIAGAALLGAQGLGLLLFGTIAQVGAVGSGRAIALAGLIGSVLALGLILGPLRAWHRGAPPARHHAGGSKESLPLNQENPHYAGRHTSIGRRGNSADREFDQLRRLR
jgi:hypothetical protein